MSGAMNTKFGMKWRHVRGVSLLEVLIVLLILSIGLLAVAGLQMRSLKNTQSSLQRTSATMISYSLLDAIRANIKANAKSETDKSTIISSYNLNKTCDVPSGGGSLSSNDLQFWIQELKSQLGDASTTCLEISCTSGGVCTIGIYWDDSRGAGGSSAQKIETVGTL